jgi:pimeloyl-ACP methyl ester carboxylesterase
LKKTDTSRQAELVSLVYNGMTEFSNSIPENLPDKQNSILGKTKIGQQDYKVLRLDDGRNLAYAEYGDLNGEPVFHCHSIFGSRLELAFDAHNIARQKSVRLIVLDRPGYGASDPNPKASFVNWSEDLIQLADHLNIGRFSLTGYVMGGMYALACAHEIPERIKRVASISNGMMPESSSDYKEFIPFYRMNIRLAKYMPKAYGLISSILIKGALSDPNSFIEQMSENLNQADREIMDSQSFKAELVTSIKEAFLQGGKACSREMVDFTHDWSFNLSDIKIPVDIWHGSTDCHQPQILSERFTEHIKNTKLIIKEEAGHYMFFTHWAEILDELLK